MEQTRKLRETNCIKRYYKNIRPTIKFLRDEKINFQCSFTSYTAMIKIMGSNKMYMYSKEGLKNDFSLLSKLKKEIKSKNLHVDAIRSNMVKYFSLTNLKPCFHKKVYNIDISDCYPTTLKNLGFISDEFYELLKPIEKIKKLKTIGQIATKKTVYTYHYDSDGTERLAMEQKENEYMRNVWFAICHETGETIYECEKATQSFLFFWFDGIYFKNKKDAKKIEDILIKRNYKFKSEILENFEVKDDKTNLIIQYKKGEKIKRFNLPKPTIL